MKKTVDGESYFHINSSANLSPYGMMKKGDAIQVGKSSNPFFRFYEVYQRTYAVTESDGSVHQIPAMSFLRRTKDDSIESQDFPRIAFETANHFLILARELFWENIRLAEFPDAPSRQRCIWLIESLEHVSAWIMRLGFKPGDFQVVRVSTQGQVVRTDGNNLAGDTQLLSVWTNLARAYWAGKKSSNPIPEVLFEGNLEVQAIVEPSKYMTT